MANVKFYLKNTNSKEPTLIYLVFVNKGKRLKYSTGQKVEPRFWNSDKWRAKHNRQFSGYSDLNGFLDKLEEVVHSTSRRLISEEIEPTNDLLRKELDRITFREKEIDEVTGTLFEFIQNYIDQRKSTNMSKGAIYVLERTLKRLKEFNPKLDFADIDLDFFFDWTNWLYAKPRLYSQNYVHKLVKTLKQFLGDATEQGVNENLAFQSKRFRIKTHDVQNIYLSLDELNELYNFQFEGKLERVRDLFLIGCFTGLRFSDFTKIEPENVRMIDDVEVIQITTQKTNQNVVIPLHPYVRAILNKYDGNIPKPMSNQKMNEYLKEMGEKINFDELVILSKSKGGQRYDVTKKKSELITTHTARRSFATNAFKSGVPTLSIMKITGHTTEQSFMKYIKVTNEENAVLMAKNAFFQGG